MGELGHEGAGEEDDGWEVGCLLSLPNLPQLL